MSLEEPSHEAREAALADLPPSAKLVYKVLEYADRADQAALAEKTRLPVRTVRYALGLLEEEALIDCDIGTRDSRKRYYSIPDGGADDG